MRKYISAVFVMIKLVVAYFLANTVFSNMKAKDVWLFQEKHTEARDNAYHLYKYVKRFHPEINCYFSILKNSPDSERIKEYGTTINADSLKHYIYWLNSKYSISSQKNGAAPYPTEWLYRFRKWCRKDQKVVFLQHGIIKDDMLDLHYEKTKFDLFVCSSEREYLQIKEVFHYPLSNVKLLGLCRYDALYNSLKEKKYKAQILIMPTFRMWLAVEKPEKEASSFKKDVFEKSGFYRHYKMLLSNEKLLHAAQLYGYRIVFYLHYSLQPYVTLFNSLNSETVVVAGRHHFDVQQLLIDSSMLITDYSSVFFDFAYMKKPEVFYQFDELEYRESHYKKGYFDYDKDGFGPVFRKEDELVNYIVSVMKNDNKVDSIYKKRADEFFAYNDNCNCERNYSAIMSIS